MTWETGPAALVRKPRLTDEERRARERARYYANRSQRLAYAKERRERDLEQSRERARRYRSENREHINATRRANWALKMSDPEERRRYRDMRREQYAADVGRWHARERAYYASHRDEQRERLRTRLVTYRDAINERGAVRNMIGDCRDEAVRAVAVKLYKLRKEIRVRAQQDN
jgi:hypothetical protein